MAIFLSAQVFAQKEMTVEEYIDRYKDISIREMEKSGIPASITLAQGIRIQFGQSEGEIRL